MAIDPDISLVRKAQAGDRQAFAELVRRHQRGVYTLALRLSGNEDHARDLAQEAFLQLFKHLHTFKGTSKFTTWLYVVVRNVCYSRHRGLATELQVIGPEGEGTGPLERIVDPGLSPEAQVEGIDDATQTVDALATLPEKYRLVLTLFHVQELSHEDIAEILGLPVGTVKTHLFRGKQLLRTKLVERGLLPA